jgi:hypothetical protein
MMGDHLTATSISLQSNLLTQSSRVVTSFVPTLLQILMKFAHMTFPTTRRFPLWKLASAQPTSNCFALDAHLLADGPLGIAQVMQLDNTLIVLLPASAALLFSLFS